MVYSGTSIFHFFIVETSSWLIVCMDIESNPGPHFSDGMFSFSHMNVNSLKAHQFIRVKAIEAYLFQHSCDIFAVTETALKADIPDDKIHINGYSCIRRDLPANTSHGGVLLYHKDNLAIKPRPDLEIHPNILVSEITISKKKYFSQLSTDVVVNPQSNLIPSFKNLTKFASLSLVKSPILRYLLEILMLTSNNGANPTLTTPLASNCKKYLIPTASFK